MSEMSDIEGKVVAITGASSGIREAPATTCAISQPGNVDVNEILIRPTARPNRISIALFLAAQCADFRSAHCRFGSS
jgi:NADP-dependent 3-hydroxy acid dehydrogenase YdfG